ncbi:ABC transporter ATP-binding protein [Nitratireductor pacificus]|uniref:Oligopeptide/dipeptide ABC transporter ATPase n=1 Tax=Nitratireductor pacificus pht-3B TaxID=391937 RepID=K2MCJ7_9HYPH|nr:ABC transporter ATP-binding protein [Nitratireductor pacificus]EKF18510.1 oligopeptide/dipeptide ABC transporter ATPase [Nitratireductor pacificus pht-3B]
MAEGTANAGPVLSVRGLKVAFAVADRHVPVVRGVDFDVYQNEVLCIVGESGSGKSVTSLAVTGLLPETARVEGSITLGGVEVNGAGRDALRRMRGEDVGFVFQDPGTTLNPVLKVGRQITEGQVALSRLRPAEAEGRAVELLRDVDIADPEQRVRQYPHQFSGGMRQRAVIAMAIAGQPKLIIADEPTTALDVTVQAQVLSVLARRQAEMRAAVVLITHDLGVVAQVADRVAVMYGGRIVETGPVEAIFRSPRHPYTRALLRSIPRMDTDEVRLDPIPGQPPMPHALPAGCAFEPRCALGSGRPRCREEEPPLSTVASEQNAACHFVDEAPPAPKVHAMARPKMAEAEAPPLLDVKGLKVHFPIKSSVLQRTTGWVRAVDGVDISVRAGETLSLVGESGCGKTTIGRTVMGLVQATAGDIRFDGQSMVRLGPADKRKARRRMQYIFQDPYSSLNPVLPAEDIVAEPLRIHGLYDEMGGAERVAELFDMVGLSRSMLSRYPSEFSGGQRQRIGIARALILAPRLVILDEPVAALDVSIQAQILNLLQDLQAELGLSYLFIAHNLSVVRHISDRVAVMYLGRIVEQGTRDELYSNPVHPYTQSLLSAAPDPDPAARHSSRRIVLEGEIPSPAAPPSGCVFHPRCFRADARCCAEVPAFRPYPGLATWTACHHAGPLEQNPAALAEVSR